MEVTIHKGVGKLQHVIEIGPHRLLTDEPKEVGGDDTGPAPHDLLAAALAACTAMTLTMYAQRKGMDLQDVQVHIEHGKEGKAYVLTRHMHYFGNLNEEEKARLTDIANKCPVHKTLEGEIRIVTLPE